MAPTPRPSTTLRSGRRGQPTGPVHLHNEPTGVVHLHNLVPGEVTLRWADRAVHLAPLGSKQLGPTDAAALEPLLADSRYVELEHHPASRRGAVCCLGSIVAAALALVAVVLASDGWRWPLAWSVAAASAAVGLAFRYRPVSLARVGGWLRDKAALILVLAIGFVLPAAALLFATPLFSDLRGDAGHALDFPLSSTVTLRLLQVLFLGVAITFPALLYFLFDRQRAGTLRQRFVLHVLRFDPRVHTRADVDALYGRQMAEAFGSAHSGHDRSLVRHRAPMIVATVVIAIGWIVASINLYALDNAGEGSSLSIALLFRPDPSVLAYGFLGAYFFAVNSVLRSYVRGDLQPKSYSQITARVLVVVVLTALISVTGWGSNDVVIAVAFFAGIVPDTILQLIWERLHSVIGAGGRDVVSENQPLTELDGIDIYERARLAGEGVENVEALAHGNVVDLLLQTLIPAPRLVDWVDQAVLYLATTGGRAEGRRSLFDALRSVGLRTATDVHRLGHEPGGEPRIVEAVGAGLTQAKLALLLGSVAEAQWMPNLLYWRDDQQPPSIELWLDQPGGRAEVVPAVAGAGWPEPQPLVEMSVASL